MSWAELSCGSESSRRMRAIHSPGAASGMSRKKGALMPGVRVNSESFPTEPVAGWKSSISTLIGFVSDDASLTMQRAEVSLGLGWMSAAMIPMLFGVSSSAMLRTSIPVVVSGKFAQPSVMRRMRWLLEFSSEFVLCVVSMMVEMAFWLSGVMLGVMLSIAWWRRWVLLLRWVRKRRSESRTARDARWPAPSDLMRSWALVLASSRRMLSEVPTLVFMEAERSMTMMRLLVSSLWKLGWLSPRMMRARAMSMSSRERKFLSLLKSDVLFFSSNICSQRNQVLVCFLRGLTLSR